MSYETENTHTEDIQAETPVPATMLPNENMTNQNAPVPGLFGRLFTFVRSHPWMTGGAILAAVLFFKRTRRNPRRGGRFIR